jgi:hypothetical protein
LGFIGEAQKTPEDQEENFVLAKLLLDSNPTEPYWEDSFMTVVFRYLYHDRISN